MKQKSAKRKKVKGKAVTTKPKSIDPVAAAWLEDKPSEAEYRRMVENYNTLKGYERLPMPGDTRTEKEKYQSHMVIVVRKDELPEFGKMDAEAIQAWCEQNDASPYLKRKNYEALKSLLWALRRWGSVKPRPKRKRLEKR
jgi:hypothetical protein